MDNPFLGGMDGKKNVLLYLFWNPPRGYPNENSLQNDLERNDHPFKVMLVSFLESSGWSTSGNKWMLRSEQPCEE
ncbi:hypothetical protein TNIN_445181 [Trichonephila inaurata madagascariensis]|uniref:Uncharacterized protein n=1 Tax=Trichonephila inaurata madagascariensis TaxID=2747483 RepID=A0A8X7CKZ3_9ARAC|nr:hypothetical protein TNIN_445181 [Trichonephila inaurata madagascariensis]